MKEEITIQQVVGSKIIRETDQNRAHRAAVQSKIKIIAQAK